jgi:hypothetical protein
MTQGATEMTRRVEAAATELLEVADAAEARFGGLSREQLDWRPSPDRWSVAQCFDHLIKVHSEYLPAFRRLADPGARPTVWERFSPFSGFFGQVLIRSLAPESQRKVKTTKRAEPSASDLGADIIERFGHHQRELVAAMRALPGHADPRRVIVSSAISPLVTYSLADAFTIIVLHCQRHFLQAERVTQEPCFPAKT